jgi:outer membrane receptor protein involved in Fe transport
MFNGFSYVMDVTNVSLFYSKVYFDVISLDWFSLGVTYNFNLNFPVIIPYVPLHSLDGVLKFGFGGFYLALSLLGEYLISSDGVDFDIPPYAIVSIDSEYEIIKGISLSLNCRNLLNNIAEFRKGSVISEGVYVSLGIKVKL